MADVDADTPVEPFDANLAGVQALIPEVELLDTLAIGQRGVTKDQVRVWLVELTGHVLLRLSRYTALDDVRQDVVVAMARDILHNGAASYAEAAAFPERTGRAETSYDQVLWKRYLGDRDALEAQVDEWLDAGGGPGAGGISASFPCPAIPDSIGF